MFEQELDILFFRIFQLNSFDDDYHVKKAELEQQIDCLWSEQQMRTIRRRQESEQQHYEEMQRAHDHYEKLHYGE